MTRSDLIFSIRYGVRVLERHAALWKSVDRLCRFVSLLAGSGAIAALGAGNQGFTLACGLVFAAVQAFEFSVNPGEKSAASRAQSRPYADLWAAQSDHDEAALERAWRRVVAADEVTVVATLKCLAYNDVTEEMGLDAASCYRLTFKGHVLALLS